MAKRCLVEKTKIIINKIKKISFSIALLLVVKSSLSAPADARDSIPAERDKLVRCAAMSARDWAT